MAIFDEMNIFFTVAENDFHGISFFNALLGAHFSEVLLLVDVTLGPEYHINFSVERLFLRVGSLLGCLISLGRLVRLQFVDPSCHFSVEFTRTGAFETVTEDHFSFFFALFFNF